MTARFLLAVALVAVGTYLLRAGFLLFANRLPRLQWGGDVLRMLPPAVLTAIIVPAVIWPEGVLQLAAPRVGAVVVALVVAWRTRNVLATLVAGLGTAILLQALA